MDVWQWILYAGASLLAFKALVSLMVRQKRQYMNERIQQQERERRTQAKKNANAA